VGDVAARRFLGSLAAAAALVAVASCSTSSDGAARTATTANGSTTTEVASADAPTGVLVPGGSITIGGDAVVDTRADGETFEVTRTDGGQVLIVSSTEGTLLGPTGVPLRCGEAAFPGSTPELEDQTEVTGASAHLEVPGVDGDGVSITTVNPAMAATDRPERLAGIPASELAETALVSPEVARQLADQPADEPLVVHQWDHAFDAGLAVEAQLAGSLARGLSYRFEFAGAGERGLSTDLGGIPCNSRTIAIRPTPDATYQLVLLAGGATLQVDGEPQTDTVADPTMQGSWAVAKVTAEAGEAEVEVLDPAGKRVERWTLAFTEPGS
jgi:hypothetical protein